MALVLFFIPFLHVRDSVTHICYNLEIWENSRQLKKNYIMSLIAELKNEIFLFLKKITKDLLLI